MTDNRELEKTGANAKIADLIRQLPQNERGDVLGLLIEGASPQQIIDMFDVLTRAMRAALGERRIQMDAPGVQTASEVQTPTSVGGSIITRPAIQTPARNNPETPMAGNEVENSLQEIDKSITMRRIWGKFSGRLVLHGQQLTSDDYNSGRFEDYRLFPDGSNWRADPTNQFFSLNQMEHSALHSPNYSTEVGRSLAAGHVMAYSRDPDNPALSRLALVYPDRFGDRSGRTAYTFMVIFELPSASLDQLRNLVQRNPDTAERFYQTAARGVDDNATILRLRSTQLAIVDLDTFMPCQQFADPNSQTPNRVKVDAGNRRNLNPAGVSILNYSQPYGKVS